MALVELQTLQFRNLVPQSLSFSSQFNLVYGANGSGKSSLLEAIGYLGMGRSFRVPRHEAVVCHGTRALTVFGRVRSGFGDRMEHRVGYSRDLDSRETLLKVDGERVKQLSALAQYLPVTVIDPGSFQIVAGGPAQRRQFIDWMVFHVEHGFAADWRKLQRVVGQRNKVLRNDRIDEQFLAVWDRQYCELAELVTSARERVFRAFLPCLEELIRETGLEWAKAIRFDLFRGWDRKTDLPTMLKQHREQELRSGHTVYGPNRADLRIRLSGRPVHETLSRGQQKTLVVLLKVAQARLLYRHGIECTFLLDDINAELDVGNQRLLAGQIEDLGSQAFITSIERPNPNSLWNDEIPDFKMFHVEHGKLTEE